MCLRAALSDDPVANHHTSSPPFLCTIRAQLSDNPVANDAKAVLDASKADALAQNVNNTITKDVSAVGIKRMEVPQGRFVPPDLSATQGNENFGAASLRRSGIERPDSSRNAVQRFTDATNRNIQENVIKGSKPPFAK
ncbi:MAG: hypothetical protein WDW38_007657 [Sanguina aurantia]